MRLEESMQGAFQARAQYQGGGKDKRFNKKKRVQTYRNKVETFPPYTYCKKKIISRSSVGGYQTSSAKNMDKLDMLKESAGHNNMKKR
jgi:hypothetical protein